VTPDEIADEIELQALATVHSWTGEWPSGFGPADLDIPEEDECPTPT
jgi:hypothetical protein